MKIERILFATDFSENSRAALEYASRFASNAGARMYIVHVDSLLDIKLPTFPPELAGSPYDAPWGHERTKYDNGLSPSFQRSPMLPMSIAI